MTNIPYEEYRETWSLVLPDGPAYNHWGGKALSDRVISLLELNPSHSVLDVCCGEGGTLSALPQVRFKCGVDISAPALKRCADREIGGVFVKADAHWLPFENDCFDRVFTQDADVWLQGDVISVLREISRVLKPDGIFVFQNYVQSREMPQEAIVKTQSVLHSSGFMHTELLMKEDLDDFFRIAGLVIKERHDLHELYSLDNAQMLRAASRLKKSHRSLTPLFEWEAHLFSKRWWTGIMLVARSAKNCTQQVETQ